MNTVSNVFNKQLFPLCFFYHLKFALLKFYDVNCGHCIPMLSLSLFSICCLASAARKTSRSALRVIETRGIISAAKARTKIIIHLAQKKMVLWERRSIKPTSLYCSVPEQKKEMLDRTTSDHDEKKRVFAKEKRKNLVLFSWEKAKGDLRVGQSVWGC